MQIKIGDMVKFKESLLSEQFPNYGLALSMLEYAGKTHEITYVARDFFRIDSDNGTFKWEKGAVVRTRSKINEIISIYD